MLGMLGFAAVTNIVVWVLRKVCKVMAWRRWWSSLRVVKFDFGILRCPIKVEDVGVTKLGGILINLLVAKGCIAVP